MQAADTHQLQILKWREEDVPPNGVQWRDGEMPDWTSPHYSLVLLPYLLLPDLLSDLAILEDAGSLVLLPIRIVPSRSKPKLISLAFWKCELLGEDAVILLPH